MAGVTAAIGAGVGLAGSLYSSKKQADAAKKAGKMAQFNPYGITGPGGTSTFDRASGTATGTLSPEQQALYSQLLGGANTQFSGGGYGGFLQPFLEQGAGGQIPGFYNQAQAAAGQLPYGETNQFLGSTFGRQGMVDAAGMGFLGQAMGMNPQMDAYAQQALQQGFGAFNTPDPAGYQQQYEDRLGLLREQAQPFEQRQVLGELNSQFGRGIKDADAGFERQKALSRGLAQADTSRQLDSMGFAENLWARDMQNTLAQRQLGLGMTNQGFGAQNAQMSNQLQQQQLLGSLGSSLLGQGQQFSGLGYDAQLGLNQLQNSRALQQLASAQQLFGFGQQNLQNNFNLGMQQLGGAQTMDQAAMQRIALGGNLGGQQASAGANAGQFMMDGAQNNVGDFFAGLGGGIFDMAMQGYGQTPTTTPTVEVPKTGQKYNPDSWME